MLLHPGKELRGGQDWERRKKKEKKTKTTLPLRLYCLVLPFLGLWLQRGPSLGGFSALVKFCDSGHPQVTSQGNKGGNNNNNGKVTTIMDQSSSFAFCSGALTRISCCNSWGQETFGLFVWTAPGAPEPDFPLFLREVSLEVSIRT